MPMPKQNNGFKEIDSYAKYSGIAFEMLGIIALCTWAGVKLDARLHTRALFTVVLSLGGVAAAMYMVIVKTREKQ